MQHRYRLVKAYQQVFNSLQKCAGPVNILEFELNSLSSSDALKIHTYLED